MFNEKYSHEKKFTFDSKDNVFIDLKDYATKFEDWTIPVKGMFIYQAKKGPRGAIVTDGYNINVPKHLNADIESIMANAEEVAAINDGKCAFKITTYIDNKNGNGLCYSGSFIDA